MGKGSRRVSFVGRLSLSRRALYRRFHCSLPSKRKAKCGKNGYYCIKEECNVKKRCSGIQTPLIIGVVSCQECALVWYMLLHPVPYSLCKNMHEKKSYVQQKIIRTPIPFVHHHSTSLQTVWINFNGRAIQQTVRSSIKFAILVLDNRGPDRGACKISYTPCKSYFSY